MAASFLDSTGPAASTVVLTVRAVGFLAVFAAVPNRVMPLAARAALALSFVVFLIPFTDRQSLSLGELVLLSQQNVSAGGPPIRLTQLLGQLAFGVAFGLEAGAVLFAASLFAKWMAAQLGTTADSDFHWHGDRGGFAAIAPAVILASLIGLFDVAPELFRVVGESFSVLPVTAGADQLAGHRAVAGQIIGALVSFAGSAALLLGLPVFATVLSVSIAGYVAQRLCSAMMSRSLLCAALVPIVILAVAAQLLRSPVVFQDISSDRLQSSNVISVGEILRQGSAK